MEKFAAEFKTLCDEFKLLRQELQIIAATTTRTSVEITEIHSLMEDVGQKLDIIDARPLTNPTPKARTTKRQAIASTPVITDAGIPAVVDKSALPNRDVETATPVTPKAASVQTTTPSSTPRPAVTDNIKQVKPEAKKYNRKTYFNFMYKQNPHYFDESLDEETIGALPKTEPARNAAIYKLFSDDPELNEWLGDQVKLASKV